MAGFLRQPYSKLSVMFSYLLGFDAIIRIFLAMSIYFLQIVQVV
jgi:hypothetical protein